MKKLYFFFALSLLILSAAATPELHKINYADTVKLMRMNLYDYNADGSTFRIDGTVTQYDDIYSDNIDGYDGRKMINPGVNVCLLRNKVNLVVERRHTIVSADTIFFNIWGLQKKAYQLKFIGVNLNQPGLSAYLEDHYLHTFSPISLNDTTVIKIEINSDPASSLHDRFRVIYKEAIVPVIHFTALAGKQIFLNWTTANNDSIKKYWIQRSSDGSDFSDVGVVNAPNPLFNKYEWSDPFPSSAINFYRIKSMQTNGKTEYSEVIKIKGGLKEINKISLFPNPATGSNMNLKLENQPSGKYQVRIFNSNSQAILEQSFDFNGGNGIQKLTNHQSIIHGVYHLQVIKPTGDKEVLEVVF